MSDKPKLKVVFPPEVLAQMEQEMSIEEMQEFMDTVHQLAESGELFDSSEPVDMDELLETDPQLHADLTAALEAQGFESVDELIESGKRTRPTLN